MDFEVSVVSRMTRTLVPKEDVCFPTAEMAEFVLSKESESREEFFLLILLRFAKERVLREATA